MSKQRFAILRLTASSAAVLAVALSFASAGLALRPDDKLRDAAYQAMDRALDGLSADLLSPFSLTLNKPLTAQTAVPASAEHQTLSSGVARYVRVGLKLQDAGPRSVLPAPQGLEVLDANLYFAEGRALTEVGMLVAAQEGIDRGLERLVSALGAPDFQTTLPGNQDLVVGWRAAEGYVLATFTDLPVFRLNAFADAPEDLMAGASIVLFEGIADYALRVEQGESRVVLDRELRELMDWVEMARGSLRPRR